MVRFPVRVAGRGKRTGQGPMDSGSFGSGPEGARKTEASHMEGGAMQGLVLCGTRGEGGLKDGAAWRTPPYAPR